jgi:hypothetical protein
MNTNTYIYRLPRTAGEAEHSAWNT